MYIYNTCSIIIYMKKFEIFNSFKEPIIVIDNNKNVVYKNKGFEKNFSDFNTLQKFSHKINFFVDVCAISADDISTYSPISQALISKESYTAIVSYRSSEMKYYNISAFKRARYSVLIFKDITDELKVDKYKEENSKLTTKLKEINTDYQNLLKTNQDNQTQALKMILINKISNLIRESIDISKILTSALGELSSMFNAFKAYYAEYVDENEFEVTEIYPKKQEAFVGTKIDYDKNTYSKIKNKETISSHCLKEFNSAEPFKASVVRIIMPVYHLDNLLGIIVLLSRQKKDLSAEINILESISAQLGNAIIQASLFRQINEQKNELQNTLKELQETQLQLIHSEKMASLGQLVAGVAHEINTPLGSIKSNNGIISKLVKQIEDKDLAELFAETTRIDKVAIDRISNIVVSLKKFVRLDEEQLQEADINKELDLTLEIIYHETKNKAEIIKNYSELPMIKCYPNMLNQVFMNILMNACQAIENKGTITISTEIDENNLVVKIKDNGKGIKKENLNKIFDAGFTTKSVGVGTGLGLAISSKIVAKHNGTIKVLSEENIGTEFIITIPVERA